MVTAYFASNHNLWTVFVFQLRGVKLNSFLVIVASLLCVSAVSACEVNSLDKVSPEMAAKLAKANIRTIQCDSLQTALASYGKKLTPGGRRLETEETVSPKEQEDSLKKVCASPLLRKKITAANSIADEDVRIIVTAAILDEAGEYLARDTVLNDPKVKLCNQSKK